MIPKTKISAQQVQQVETVRTPDGQTHCRIYVKLTPEQKDHFRRAREEIEAEFPPKRLPARPRLG